MAAPIPTREPESFTQGVTVQWTKSLGDFNASDSYVLTYEFSGPSAVTPVVGTPNGDVWDVTISAAVSALYPVGNLYWQAFVSLGADRFQVDAGTFNVLQDLSTINDFDGRTENQKMLDALDAALLGQATVTQKKYKLGDMEIESMLPTDLMTFRNQYAAFVVQEKRLAKVKNGESHTGQIKIRF